MAQRRIQGQGVKIGIIDTGFQGFRSLMGTELPSSASVEARCYTDMGVFTLSLADCDNADASEHGTAVTEAAFDIAPEATYYIATPGGSHGDIVTAVDWMIEHDVDVINMSLGFTWEGPGDGTTPYTNGIQRSVATPVAGGITWVNSAGNESQSTWFGRFTDTDGNRLHEFTANDNCNNYALYVEGELFAARFLREENLKIQLRWDDRWGGANRDLNLILARYDEGTGRFEIYDSSDSAQSGGAAHIPFEYINVTVPAGAYCLAIDRKNGTMPNWIQLQDFTRELLLHHTLHHSIGNPAESRNLGLLAVGAAPAFETNTIEPYSSQGPTPDGRMKPDIVGVARGQSVSYSSAERPDGRWAGTSQSSPHVAGLAALVKQRFPDYTPEQIANYLKTHADPRGAVPNNTWGYGFARLPATDEATSTPGPTATAEPTPEPTPSPEPTPEPTPEPMPTPPADPCAENLEADSTIQGSWSDDCPSESRSGSYASYYTFSIAESSDVTIRIESSVDTYLYLHEGAGRDGSVLHENDDIVSGNTNSEIQETLSAGTYTIEATTYDAGATGDFTLTVSGLPAAVEPSPTPEPTATPEPTVTPPVDSCVETVNADGAVSGSWDSNCASESRADSYASYYTFTLAESAEVTVTLEASVDTYLYMREGAGRDGSVLHENDDIVSGNTNSEIQETLSAGTYTIEATTYDAGATGQFTLTVSGLPAAVEPSPTPEPTPTPTPVPSPSPPQDTPGVVVSAGPNHACALDTNGEIACRGVNDSNQVSGRPTDSGYIALSVGGKHSCAIDSGGNLKCWGSDASGQVSNHPTSNGFVAVSVGDKHSCAIDANSVVQCWGSNEYGQSSAPSHGTYVAIGAGDNYTCGLRSDNNLECWGRFEAVDGSTPSPSPTPTPTPSPTPTPGNIGTRTNPVHLGQFFRPPSSHWELRVVSVDRDAWPEIQADSGFSDPPEAGNTYVSIRIAVLNRGSASGVVFSLLYGHRRCLTGQPECLWRRLLAVDARQLRYLSNNIPGWGVGRQCLLRSSYFGCGLSCAIRRLVRL